MPEGPEVRVITTQLAKVLIGWKLTKISITGGSYATSEATSYKNFRVQAQALNRKLAAKPRTITQVSCKGKHIFMRLEASGCQPVYLFNHLGMAAYWTLEEGNHSNVSLLLEDDDLTKVLYFDDQRHFGRFFLLTEQQKMLALRRLGPDIFARNFTLDRMKLALSQVKNKMICTALMDQHIISGIGNYLRADILYVAKIYPYRLVSDLTEVDYVMLHTAILRVSQAAYKANGTTIENYKDMNGDEGHYVPLVYGRKLTDNNEVVQSDTVDNRTLYWVPEAQKPR